MSIDKQEMSLFYIGGMDYRIRWLTTLIAYPVFFV